MSIFLKQAKQATADCLSLKGQQDESIPNNTSDYKKVIQMKVTISLDSAVLEQLLAYTQTKTAKESIAKAIDENIRCMQRQELLSYRGTIDYETSNISTNSIEKSGNTTE